MTADAQEASPTPETADCPTGNEKARQPRAALVVAHPDDESLWFAGYVLRHPYNWIIIACSIPRIDPVRAWKFYDACRTLGAQGRVLPHVESPPDRPLAGLHMLDLNGFDLIVTHGDKPEPGYGFQHPHHAQVHSFVVEKWAHKPCVFLGGAEQIRLDSAELARKQEALRCYDHLLPYQGRLIAKHTALMHRYCEAGGYDLATESYTP